MSQIDHPLLSYRVAKIEEREIIRDQKIDSLDEKLDKLIVTFLGFALSFALLAVSISVTLLLTQ